MRLPDYYVEPNLPFEFHPIIELLGIEIKILQRPLSKIRGMKDSI